MKSAIHSPKIIASDFFQESEKYSKVRETGSGDWLIFYTLSGHGVFISGKIKTFSRRGDIHLYAPGHYQKYKTFGKTWKFFWAHFHPRENWSRWLNLPSSVIEGLLTLHIHRNTIKERVEKAMRQIIVRDHLPIHHKKYLTLNALEEALLWISEVNPNLRDISRDERVEKALEIISISFTQKHTVESLAREVSLSPSRFAHLFKEQTGQSVIDTLIAYRLAEAAKLLEFTSSSIKSISDQTGFQNPYYFSRLFSQKYGLPPRNYRKIHPTLGRPTNTPISFSENPPLQN